MEAKLEQQLEWIVHEPLFQVFIDVQNSYDSLDRSRCMKILRGCGLVPKLQQLLQRYWDGQKVALKAGKFFGRIFGNDRGVT